MKHSEAKRNILSFVSAALALYGLSGLRFERSQGSQGCAGKTQRDFVSGIQGKCFLFTYSSNCIALRLTHT